MRIVYSPRYNISGYGIEKLHPFDGRKFAKAWTEIASSVPKPRSLLIAPRPVSAAALARVHAAQHLADLKSAKYLAQVFEVPQAAWIPAIVLDRVVLRPMRFATGGTIAALRAALEVGLAVNLGGGFHHAKPNLGEGFNVYNDVAIAIAELRAAGDLAPDAPIVYVDCDAHQANGICHCFLSDRTVKIFDVFNSQIYPQYDWIARERIDHPIPLAIGAEGDAYLLELQRALPVWLDSLIAEGEPAIAIYNAGTDVIADDPLGALDLLPPHVLERDLFVVSALRARGIPTVLVLGGGYTATSYRLVADSVIALARRYAAK